MRRRRREAFQRFAGGPQEVWGRREEEEEEEEGGGGRRRRGKEEVGRSGGGSKEGAQEGPKCRDIRFSSISLRCASTFDFSSIFDDVQCSSIFCRQVDVRRLFVDFIRRSIFVDFLSSFADICLIFATILVGVRYLSILRWFRRQAISSIFC